MTERSTSAAEISFTDVIGALSGGVDRSVLNNIKDPRKWDPLMKLLEGVRTLAFLTGIKEEAIPSVLRCSYRQVDWNLVDHEVLEDSATFVDIARDFVSAVFREFLRDGSKSRWSELTSSSPGYVVDTHRKVRLEFNCTTTRPLPEAFEVTRNVTTESVWPIIVASHADEHAWGIYEFQPQAIREAVDEVRARATAETDTSTV